MLNQQSSAPTSTSTTPLVRVERMTAVHRTAFPGRLGMIMYAAAVYSDGVLTDVLPKGAPTPDEIPSLIAYARGVALKRSWAYDPGCGYCGIACGPRLRAEHVQMLAGSETVIRQRWAA